MTENEYVLLRIWLMDMSDDRCIHSCHEISTLSPNYRVFIQPDKYYNIHSKHDSERTNSKDLWLHTRFELLRECALATLGVFVSDACCVRVM
jgi:hypothetical protein